MSELERNHETLGGISPQAYGAPSSGSVTVEVACDDRQTQLEVQGSDIIGQIRHRALAEMQILASDPSKYVVIDSNRQPISDQQTVNEILRQGQALYFRLIPQVAFGEKRCEVQYA